MDTWVQALITIVCSMLASTGLWAFLQRLMEKRDVRSQMLKGLGHDRIVYLATQYLKRGWVTADEYENLYEYLYKPYEALGGNGLAKTLVEKVSRLEIKENPITETKNKKGGDET